MTKLTSKYSEDCPITYTLKGYPEVNTDHWKIASVATNNDNILANIVDNTTFNIVPISKDANDCNVNVKIKYVDMPLAKDNSVIEFEWQGTEYVSPIDPIVKFEGDYSVDNGEYIYKATITNEAACSYPIECEWSVTKKNNSNLESSAVGVMVGNNFKVTYSGITEADGVAQTLFEITLSAKSKYNTSHVLYSTSYYVHTDYEAPVITMETNKPLIHLFGDMGWISNYVYTNATETEADTMSGCMYQNECDKIDDTEFAKLTKYNGNTRQGSAYKDDNGNIYKLDYSSGSAQKINCTEAEIGLLNIWWVYGVTSCNELQYFNNITTIPNSCFLMNSSSLKTVVLPKNLTSVDYAGFQGCYGLTSIDFSQCTKLTTISTNAFYYCSGLLSVDLSNTKVTSIGSAAFRYNRSMSTFTAPNTLKYIYDETFRDCYISSLDFRDTQLKSIGSECFQTANKSNTCSIYFPSTLTSLGSGSLSNVNIITLSFDGKTAPTTTSNTFTDIGSKQSESKFLLYPSEATGYDGDNWSVFDSNWTINNI